MKYQSTLSIINPFVTGNTPHIDVTINAVRGLFKFSSYSEIFALELPENLRLRKFFDGLKIFHDSLLPYCNM